MARSTLHIVAVVPPSSVLSILMGIADRLHIISPSSHKTLLPHLCLTAVYDHEEQVDVWKAELHTVLSLFRPFTIEVGKAIRMSNGPLPDNFSLPVPTTAELEAISRAIASITHRHFPELDENGLRSMTDHIYLIEKIPDGPRHFVVKEATKLWSPRSFEVDSIRILDVDGYCIKTETIPLAGAQAFDYSIIDKLGEDQQWILAMLHALGGYVESKLKYQKMLFLVDYEGMNKRNRFNYAPYTHGPWSGDLERETRQLQTHGLFRYADHACTLTETGQEIAAEIFTRLPPLLRDKIAKCVKKYGNRSTTEIQTYVHYTYPELHALGSAYLDD